MAENSYFDFDGEEDDRSLTFSTRQNGDVGSESPGAEDIREGKRIGREILSKFPDTSVSLETVDEWVMLTVKEKRQKETKTTYVFVKHSNPDYTLRKSTGFSESFDDIEGLRKKVESSLPEVDFTELEVDLEDLKLHSEPSYLTGNFRQGRILISKPEDNRFGYYFTVLKTQRDI